ncbi:Crp/Fnr family transcriptional regulator [Lacrimispora sp.]|uniref:Crp/Fnr family transcriptional regulator n=1 Tax=Lacrimispora sp. TaxID=2719234 RepID=UPI0028A6538E|nr:Crp/Fnr family transcriptional regulator [Lacrimispora sp.]
MKETRWGVNYGNVALLDEKAKQFYQVLKDCSCFEGIPEDKVSAVLCCLRARYRAFTKGNMILQVSDRENLAGIVLKGTAELTLYSENGSQININHCSAGDMFGEDLACSESVDSSMQIWAVTDCEILFLDFSSLFNMEGGTCPFKMRVSTNLLREFAEKARFLNDKVRILAQKRLRDKLKVYLQMQKSSKEGMIELPFRRNELAEFLCVDRSALSRELSRMQQDGILSYEGKNIQIHDNTFFQ